MTGAELWDIDGNRYIDHLLALGPMIHGHAHPEMTEAVTTAIRDLSTMYALPYELEAEAARAIVAGRAVGRARAVLELRDRGGAARDAGSRAPRPGARSSCASRASTTGGPTSSSGATTPTSTRPARCSRPNALPGSLGIPEAFGSALAVMPWNDAEAIEAFMAERGDEIAAILTEPIMGNTGVIPPNPGYLQLLRDLTTEHGSVLIFDEVITGFRVALGGAQAKYGVTPGPHDDGQGARRRVPRLGGRREGAR